MYLRVVYPSMYLGVVGMPPMYPWWWVCLPCTQVVYPSHVPRGVSLSWYPGVYPFHGTLVVSPLIGRAPESPSSRSFRTVLWEKGGNNGRKEA